LQDEISGLKKTIKNNENEIGKLNFENAKLKQALLLNIFNVNAVEQYGRRENIRIHNVPEKAGNHDDGEEIVLQIAEELGISIESHDIQRAHRLGKKKRSSTAKPRQIIARFVSYKHRNELLRAKSGIKGHEPF